jgi:hypothetical protein
MQSGFIQSKRVFGRARGMGFRRFRSEDRVIFFWGKVKGDLDAVKKILTICKNLVGFYPGHMEKEEKQFFTPSMEYFSKKGTTRDREKILGI